MEDWDQPENYKNILQCLKECNGIVAHAQNIYFERYGKDPPLETISRAMRLHGDNNVDEKYVKDADMSRTTENENEEDVMIKEEDIEIGEECIIKPNDSKSDVEFIPVVYTTRLDDMPIFERNFASLTVDDIVCNIILESKPKLTKPFKYKTKSIPTYTTHPFFKLVDKIREFNELSIVQDDDDNFNILSNVQDGDDDFNVLFAVNDSDDVLSSDNENGEETIPLKLLTPKRNNLNINRKVKAAKLKPKTTSKEIITQIAHRCKPCTIPLTPSCRVFLNNGTPYVIYDKESREPVPFIKGVLYKINFGCYIEITNDKTKSTDIYVFDIKGLFSKTISSDDEFDYVFTKRCNGRMGYCLKVSECCWFHREYVLKSLILPQNIDKEAVFAKISILRKPHPCPSGRCTCCCKINTIEDDEIEEIPVVNLIEASAETVACQVVRSFIDHKNKADTPRIRKDKLSSENNAKTAKHLIKTKDRLGIQILKNYSDLTEFYELRSNGNILKHIEIKSKYLRTSHNFRRKMKLNADSDKEFCCWRKRDAMLRTFEFRYTMITQFIRTPHPCPPGHCICCCKPSLLKTSLTVNDLTTLKYAPINANNYTNINKQRRKFFAKPKNIQPSEKNTSDLQGDINAESSTQYEINNNPVDSEIICNEMVDYESFIAGDIIDKTVDFTLTRKNDLQEGPIKNKGVPSQIVSRNKIIGKTNVAQKMATQKRLVEKTSTVTQSLSKTLKAPVASPPTQPQQQASQPQVPTPSSLLPMLQQPRPPLGPHPGPSQLEKNTIAPAQSNVAFSPNNSFPVLTPLTNIPLRDDAQGPTVNSLVQSILQRFKDVRLIITPDGDVSAELSMPLQNLTTAELQMLSKILTHAKAQVKVLKAAGHLNSGTNTVLNPWPSNLLSSCNSIQTPGVNTTPVIIQTTPTAPVVIGNANVTDAATLTTASSSTISTEASKTMINNENDVDGKLRNNAFQCYTNLSALKMREYLTSCRSYLNIKFSPKIGNVFSLNENATKIQSKKQETNIKDTKKIEDIPNSKTSGVKRKKKENPKCNTKKLKTMELTKPIELDASEAETPPGNMMPAPILSGILNTPYAVPTGASPVIDPNLLYVAPVSLSSGVPPMVEPPVVVQYIPLSQFKDPPRDTPANEDDCILGF